jgi:sec-independent protein translocase protein TatB
VFGLSWGQIIIIVLVGMFVLGPERIPVAVQWTVDSLRKVRNMAQGAQAQLQKEIGPELEELRRQVAELQSLKEVQELRNLRDLNPRRLIGNTLLGNDGASSGGIAGFLGLDPNLLGPPSADGESPAAASADGGSSNGAQNGTSPNATSQNGSSPNGSQTNRSDVGVAEPAGRSVSPALAPGERPPFDPDGT